MWSVRSKGVFAPCFCLRGKWSFTSIRGGFFFFLFRCFNQHQESERAKYIYLQTKLLSTNDVPLFSWEEAGKSHLWKSVLSVLAILPSRVTELKHTSTLSLPESCGVIHAPLWVIPALLPSFHFLVTISVPTTCKVICESRELLFSQVVYHHFVPKSCEYYRQLYLEEAVLTLAIEEIIPELCMLSEVVISCHSSPLLKKKKKRSMLPWCNLYTIQCTQFNCTCLWVLTDLYAHVTTTTINTEIISIPPKYSLVLLLSQSTRSIPGARQPLICFLSL